MSIRETYTVMHTAMRELHESGIRALEQCRRRGFATRELLTGQGFTDPDWRVSVPGSGYGSGGGLGTRDPFETGNLLPGSGSFPGGGFGFREDDE